MNEKDLQQYLLEHFPKENAACEWKEFKNLRHALRRETEAEQVP